MKLKGLSNDSIRRIAQEINPMVTYLIVGEDRQTGAIGASEPFEEQVEASSLNKAYETIREKRYNENREAVHIMYIYELNEEGNGRLVYGPGTQR